MAKISGLAPAGPITGEEIIPLVQEGETRRLDYDGLVAPFAAQTDMVVATAQALVNFRKFIADGVADFAVGEYFASGESGQLLIYERIAGPPGYLALAPEISPLTRSDVGTIAEQDANDVDVTGGRIGGAVITVERLQRPGFHNFNSRSMPRWTAKVARHRARVERAKFAGVGDSNTSGVGSNPASATADCRRRGFAAVFARAMFDVAGIKAQANSIWCDGFEGANIEAFDPRLTMEAGWEIHDAFVTGGRCFIDPATNTSLPKWFFDPASWGAGHDTDTAELFWVTAPGNAQLIVLSDAAYVDNGNTHGALGIGRKLYTRADNFDLPWEVQKSGITPDANLQIVGMDAWNSADFPMSIWNMGASGSRALHWVEDNQPYNFQNAIQVIAPDLTRICLTTNDCADDTAEVDYLARMRIIIESCLVSGDVYLAVGIPSNVGTAPLERQYAFAERIMTLAAEYDNLPVVNHIERWVSQSYLPARDFYYDGVHGSQVGVADYAYAEARVIGNPGTL